MRSSLGPPRKASRNHGSELGPIWSSALALVFLACSGETPDPAPSTGGAANGTAGAHAGTTGGAGSPASSGGEGGTSGSSSGGSGGSGAGAGGAGGGGGLPSTGGAPTGGSPSSDGGSSGSSAGSGGSGGSGPLGPVTIWIAGDSTVATKGGTPCPIGWGGQFDALFNEQVTVVNSAVGGRSVRTWLYDVTTTKDGSGECVRNVDGQGQLVLQQRWQDMLSGMKSGDYLFIQFGINDGSADCPRHVGLQAFKAEYGMMAQAAKERGAHPVFVTPVSAVACNGGTPRGTRGAFVTTTQEAGEEFDVPVIDLHAASVALYTTLGFCPIPGGDVSASTTGPVGDFFCDDHTHFAEPGAVEIAKLVAKALVDQSIGLADYLE